MNKKNSLNKEPLKRSLFADILKTLAIFSVVFIHGNEIIPFKDTTCNFPNNYMIIFAYSFRFCVPIFIFIWAYFMQKTYLKKGNTNIILLFKKLFIPYAAWSLLYFIINVNFQTLTPTKFITSHMAGYGWSGQYYFIILFQLILTFSVIQFLSKKLKKKHLTVHLVAIVFYIFIAYSSWFSNPFIKLLGERPFFYWTPYVFLGIMLSNKKLHLPRVPFWLGILSIFLIPLEVYFLAPQDISKYQLPSVYISTTILIYSAMNIKPSYQTINTFLCSTLQIISRYTLGIFCLNPLVIYLLRLSIYKYKITFNFPFSAIISPLIGTLSIFLICITTIFFLKKIKLGRFVST